MWGLFVKKHAEAAAIYNQISILYIEPLDEGIQETEIIEKKENNLYALYIYFKKPKNLILYFIKFVQMYFLGFRKIRNRNDIDLVHVHILSRMGILAYMSKLLFGIPYVITEHWSRYLPSVNKFNGKARVFITQFIVKRAAAVLPVTADLKSAMISYGLQNLNYKVVPNVVDDLFFKPEIHKKNDPIKTVIHVSTFEDISKNISGIIRGIKKVSEIRDDFKFIFIGDGIDFDKMKAIASNLKISKKHIEFKGLLEKEQLVNEYIQADFMLINSHYENMPVVINEAFACGLPVLSTDVGGISEHLGPTRGKLMPPNNENIFIESFIWMLDNCHDFKPEHLREYARIHFSYSGVATVLDEIYSNAIS